MKFSRSAALLCGLALAGGFAAACGTEQSAAGPAPTGPVSPPRAIS